MVWDSEQPQWGKKGPSTPEEVIASLLLKFKERFGGGGSDGGGGIPPGSRGGSSPGPRRALWKIAAAVGAFFLLYIISSFFYKIEPGELGLVLRFGSFHTTSNPGLNFLLPFVDDVIKVDVERVRKEEFGFRTKVPGQKTIYEKRGFEAESLMLTGDKNVIDMEWIVQYKVRDPVHFVFKVSNVGQALRDVSESAMRQTVGNNDFDYVLSNRDIIEATTAKNLQEALDKYECGVKILTVKLQDVNPPDSVKPAFNEVNEADQDMNRLVNEAEENYNRLIPKARGDAKRVIEEAQGYAVERVNLAKGETSRFLALLKEYSIAKEVTRRRMHLETITKVLPAMKEIYLLEEADQKAVLPFLDLGGEKRAGSTTPAGK